MAADPASRLGRRGLSLGAAVTWRRAVCAVSLTLPAAVAVFTNLAANAIPKSLGWAHNEVLLWSIVTVGVIVSVVVAEVRLPTNRGQAGASAGWDLRTVIRARTVYLGSVLSGALPQRPSRVPGLGDLGLTGDTLPPRKLTFTGRKKALAEVRQQLADRAGRGPTWLGRYGQDASRAGVCPPDARVGKVPAGGLGAGGFAGGHHTGTGHTGTVAWPAHGRCGPCECRPGRHRSEIAAGLAGGIRQRPEAGRYREDVARPRRPRAYHQPEP